MNHRQSPPLSSTVRLGLLALAAVLVVAAQAAAANEVRQEHVVFEERTTAATINTRVNGTQITDYLLGAAAGQWMSVDMVADNLAAYFNVIAPGADTALFIGNLQGGLFEGELPVTGEYTVRLYMMRSAARRGETAGCTLDFRIADEPDTGDGTRAWVADGVRQATGFVPCSFRDPDLGDRCRYRAVYGDEETRIWIDEPNDPEAVWYRLYRFTTGPDVHIAEGSGNSETTGERRPDGWLIDVSGVEHYLVPDRILSGN